MIKRNIGVFDRIVRVSLGLVLLPSGLILLSGLQGSVLGLVIAGIGGIGLITGILGFCILYIPLGIDTLEKEKELVERVKSTPARMMDRCMSMMVSFRQTPAESGTLGAEQTCGPCPPSIGETPNQGG